VLATRFGTKAVELLLEGNYGQMVALQSPYIVAVPLEKVVGRTKNVPPDSDLLSAARSVGISLGE
jgi:6-phosphofructokinase 1